MMNNGCLIVIIDDEEEFRIVTYPNIRPEYYEISNYGRIRRVKDKKILRPYPDKDGYKKIELVSNICGQPHKHFIHRLVAWEFIGHPESDSLVVNHKNSDRFFNYYKNLEWVTPKENSIHGKIYGNIIGRPNMACRKYDIELIREFIRLIHDGKSNKYILDVYNLTGKKRKNTNSLLNDIRYGKSYRNELII